MGKYVLLVNPPPYNIAEPYYDTPEYPRTALAYLAGYLRSRAIEVGVLDCNYDRIGFRFIDLLKFIWNYRKEGRASLGKIIKEIFGKVRLRILF